MNSTLTDYILDTLAEDTRDVRHESALMQALACWTAAPMDTQARILSDALRSISGLELDLIAKLLIRSDYESVGQQIRYHLAHQCLEEWEHVET